MYPMRYSTLHCWCQHQVRRQDGLCSSCTHCSLTSCSPDLAHGLAEQVRHAGPVYDAANERLDLQYTVLEAELALLPLAGGTVNGGMARERVRGSWSVLSIGISTKMGSTGCVHRRTCISAAHAST